MRSFEERKAEVFRRSENRIKERRRIRRSALAAGIPLCLIITAWSVTVLLTMSPPSGSTSDTADERAESFSDVGYIQSELRVETIDSAAEDQYAVLKNNPAEIAEVYRLVQSMLNSKQSEGNYQTESQEWQPLPSDAEYEMASGYKIIFTAYDGSQTGYMLNNHILIDSATKKETVLTEGQYLQLLQALGVQNEKEDGK